MKTGGRKITGSLEKRGGVWLVRWKAGGKRYSRSTGEKAKAAARKAAVEILTPFQTRDEADRLAALSARAQGARAVAAAAARKAARVRLAEAWGKHPYSISQPKRGGAAVRDLAAGTVEENRLAWNQFVAWMAEVRPEVEWMEDVTAADALAWSVELYRQRKVSAHRHNVLVDVCRVMFRLSGMDDGVWGGVPRYRNADVVHREPFTLAQVEQLLAAAEGEMRGWIALMYFTGMRAGDAVLFRREYRDAGRLRFRDRKTGKQHNLVEHPMLTRLLDGWDVDTDEYVPKTGKPKGAMFPELAKLYLGKQGRSELAKRFKRLMEKALGADFASTVERSGHGRYRAVTFGAHSFRHSLASHAAQAGVPLGVVQAWLGHSSAEVTRIYTHYAESDLRRVMEALPVPMLLADGKVTILPANETPLEQIAILAGKMDATNWRQMRRQIISIARGKK